MLVVGRKRLQFNPFPCHLASWTPHISTFIRPNTSTIYPDRPITVPTHVRHCSWITRPRFHQFSHLSFCRWRMEMPTLKSGCTMPRYNFTSHGMFMLQNVSSWMPFLVLPSARGNGYPI